MKNSTLRPDHAAWLSDTIARNRARFVGLRMEAEGGEGKPDEGAEGKAVEKVDDGKSDDEPLGEGGKKALKAERERAAAAEDQAKALKGEFDGFKSALAQALGIKTDGDDKSEDALVAVQNQLAAMQREAAVLKLANEHGIADKEDLELLASAKDEEAMKKLAERLAPSEQERDAKSRKPKPDRTQGGGGGTGDRPSGGSVAQVIAERRAARAAKQNTNS
jgi:hypothetical protein